MKQRAFGVIGMLIALVIIGVLFVLMVPEVKNIGISGIFNSGINVNDKAILEKRVNQQMRDIEQFRSQSVVEVNKVNQEY